MTGMETASLQKYGVRILFPMLFALLGFVYMVKELGIETIRKIWGKAESPQMIDRGDRICFRGIAGKEICMHKKSIEVPPTA
jgi:hypothetical protein